MATFDGNISVTINLDAPPSLFTGFQSPLFISSDSSLDDDRVRTYTSTTSARTDMAAGFLSASGFAAVETAYSQRRRPGSVKVGRRDNGSNETFAEAIAAIVAVDNNWYTASIDERGTAASIESASGALESLEKLGVLGSDDAAWLTATPNAAFDTLRTRERTAIIWHNSVSANADFALCADRLSFNPDTISVPWDTSINGVTPYSPALTDTQANFALGNEVNLMQPYGPAPLFIDKGANVLGRPIYELFTRDWFSIRLRERMAALKVTLSQQGQKLILDDNGGAASAQQYALSIVNGLYQEGLAGNHFVDDPGAFFRAETITPSDITAQRIRITGAARFATSARLFDFDLNFTRQRIPA